MVRNTTGGSRKNTARHNKIKQRKQDDNCEICFFESIMHGKHGIGWNKYNKKIILVFRAQFFKMKNKIKKGIYVSCQQVSTTNSNVYEVVNIVPEHDERVVVFNEYRREHGFTNAESDIELRQTNDIMIFDPELKLIDRDNNESNNKSNNESNDESNESNDSDQDNTQIDHRDVKTSAIDANSFIDNI